MKDTIKLDLFAADGKVRAFRESDGLDVSKGYKLTKLVAGMIEAGDQSDKELLSIIRQLKKSIKLIETYMEENPG